MEKELASETPCFLTKLVHRQSSKKEIVSSNFDRALSCLLCMFGDAGLGLALHGLVQSDLSGLVWSGLALHT